MAQSLRRRATGALLCLALGVMAAGLHAQAMTDPTEPPSNPSSSASVGSAASSGPSLQFVMMAGKRAEAIIDGKLVQVGDRVGAARVVKISQYEAVLQGPGGAQTLRMFPEVVMQAPTTPADASRPARHDKKTDKK